VNSMTTTIVISITSKQFEMEVKEGLVYILNHTDGLWPRMVSTYTTRGAQRLVKNFAEAMAWFKAANFLDCRISAYPNYTKDYINRTGIAPTVLLVDIDKEHFKTIEEFESASARTYSNFYNILGVRPTQLATGGGNHFIIRQQVDVFEKSDRFRKFDQPSRRFMQFEERLLTDGKGDESHWKSVSFNNCMLRIPCSLNADYVQFDDGDKIINIPYDSRVRIEKYWDGTTPVVGRLLAMQYYNYLQFENINDRFRQRSYQNKVYGHAVSCINLHDYDYIDRLFNKPIDNFRKYCIWRVFVPYFINVKRLQVVEAYDRIKSWLDRCNAISRLHFNPRWKIDYALKHVGTFYPIRQDRLKDANRLFYERLKVEGIC
jgi:hypothetical protein